jgi:hypothetical protein
MVSLSQQTILRQPVSLSGNNESGTAYLLYKCPKH